MGRDACVRPQGTDMMETMCKPSMYMSTYINVGCHASYFTRKHMACTHRFIDELMGITFMMNNEQTCPSQLPYFYDFSVAEHFSKII